MPVWLGKSEIEKVKPRTYRVKLISVIKCHSTQLTRSLPPTTEGAGKTTLLDCLTGHKKSGLSGSIRISPASVSSGSSCSLPFQLHHGRSHSHARRKKPQERESAKGVEAPDSSYWTDRNLKVSIIPQNDHLMGHLTVYETLNYASKMKNCFDSQFNHKSNIKRIAQQLGLVSCLGTRINKLSGGQYKRVSIAQELLSSPDILILDEPTSGLDAMTCFQTVEVLKKLTQVEGKPGSQRQMAVILTIHQPNSDVFQQFNHVYVVAQGGKCIFEGPPSSIEPMMSQIGVRLPINSFNPATLIVEVAAGKFGLEAIDKLNCMQKKQYECLLESDEQISTGDSAVDCPSTATSISFDEDDEEEEEEEDEERDEEDEDEDEEGEAKDKVALGDHNNNLQLNQSAGLVNEGFELDSEPDIGGDANVACKQLSESYRDVIVVLPKAQLGQVYPPVNEVINADQLLTSESTRREKRRKTRRRPEELGPKINSNKLMSNQMVARDSNSKVTNTLVNDIRISTLGGHHHSSGVLLCSAEDGARSNRKLSTATGGNGPGGPNGSNSIVREKRLKLNSLKADQRFPFWRHTYLHFHRSWLSIVRDPLLCSMQLALHIIVPLMVSLVYGPHVGKPNACPRAGPMDIMAYALEPEDSALQLQEDLRTTLENIGYIFFKLYGIIFAAMTVTVLTFPLDMHVLVKEFRNGWYGISSYFLGRTLADIPFQLTLPLLAMSLSYYATGQPSSYMQWRFLSITAILILSSLIAQSQGLLFGAILMDRMKAAVFVAPAATTPIILFAGFLVRTQSIPSYLRPLSSFSYLRYAIEACLISRYGFNQCDCDQAVFNQTVPELPPIARSMLDYWLSSFRTGATESGAQLNESNAAELVATTLMPAKENPDLFTKLIDSLVKANSFGRNITSCDQVVPYPMIDYDLRDSQLIDCFAILLFMLIFTRLLTFFIVCFKVKRKV